MSRLTRYQALAWILLAGVAGPAVGEVVSADQQRTLVLVLDGVPLRAVKAVVEQGAFEGWSGPRGMISPFPSMTSVAFTALLRPFCVHPIAGYETTYFNREDNEIKSGISKQYLETYFPWRTHFIVRKRSYSSNVAGYARPMHSARKMVEKIKGLVLTGSTNPVLAHVGPTDVVTHVRGDAPIIKYLMDLSDEMKQLEMEYEERRGQRLRVVILSDHGNTRGGVTSASDLRKTLKGAGHRIRKKLESPEDIVIPTYGAVSYSALYLDPSNAAAVAHSASENEAVDLAAWTRGPGEIEVVSETGTAVIRWRKFLDSSIFSYDLVTGDPLRLGQTKADLAATNLLGADGFAAGSDWLQATAENHYPDPLRRLVDALTGAWVENPANVILSLHSDRAWGSSGAWIGAFLMGGGLEGTHGALDSESTMGFLMANEPIPEELRAIPAHQALTLWFEQGDCVAMTRVE
jgi:hypothetical protein